MFYYFGIKICLTVPKFGQEALFLLYISTFLPICIRHLPLFKLGRRQNHIINQLKKIFIHQ